MKQNRVRLLLGATLLVIGVAGRFILYSKSPRYVLDNSDQIILYSLQPHPIEGDVQIHGLFHRNGILGQTQVTDSHLKTQLITALYRGIRSSNEESACFNPRHGIRATYNGRTVDVEICFECGAVYFWENNKAHRHPVSQEPQKVFDQALVEFHLPLAKQTR